ncbi:tetratricopeptide repeat-containing sensor histidine kinase [Mucilaginibacter ginsenosidivorax]|uniref:Oxygen sensor histidine kinase NreB n=1 Tax=Mucilaginibacter ginsenosidivorax TaxID=862126 RepID=A0A5B8W3A0_9SPHI|nr:tetratricopeptide repeat protein [Mucilaginibacter ginsenosidivorax]QEC77346.1 tetratricopeptide repeat protein [Mucilaginibacter ginsenosidivorax]
MKYLLLLLFFSIILPCFGQNIDSLKKIVVGTSPAQTRLIAAEKTVAYLTAENKEETLPVARIGLNLAMKLHDKKVTGLMLRSIGAIYFLKGNYDSTAHYYGKAVDMLGTLNQQHVLADDYIALAQVYAKQKNYDKAISLYNAAIDIAPKTGTRKTLMMALSGLGQLYEDGQNYREALNYYRQSFDIGDSLDFVKKAKENTSEAYSHNFMGDVLGSMKQKSIQAPDILKTIETKKALNDTLALTINYFNLGQLYKSNRMYPQALDALQSCLQYATQINYTDMQNSAVNEIADLYGQMGDYKQSLFYLKKHAILSTAKNSKTIDELQTKYEITQREDQLLKQQFEITKRNYWMIGIIVFVLLVLLIVFVFYKQAQLKQRNAAMQAIIETEESERRRIAQDLHDSVSQTMSAAKINLTVIGGELPFVSDDQRKRFEKAINLVDYGFREVRTISHNMMPWALHKTGLAQVIKHFIENIENDTIAINFYSKGFDSPFDDTIEIILYRVLQESVNNVMKHANASRLDISLIRDETNISLTIEDNGLGFDAANPEAYSGMGLNNLRSRINFLKGKVELDSQVGRGTLVSVYVPVSG